VTLLKISRLEKGILHISLNRPEALNALSSELLQQLQQALLTAQQDVTVKALLLTGEDKAFCAGADIKGLLNLQGKSGFDFASSGQKIFQLLEELGKPSLAAVQGYAFGGGCELAMAATLRIAAQNAFFSQPEIKLGVIPGYGGTQRLARLIGKGRALELCLTGRRVAAEEALRIGLVSEVVPADELLQRASAILQELTQYSPAALRSIMTVIQQGYNLPLNEALAMEAAHFGLCCATQDKTEGVKAFLEKRAPVFSGE